MDIVAIITAVFTGLTGVIKAGTARRRAKCEHKHQEKSSAKQKAKDKKRADEKINKKAKK